MGCASVADNLQTRYTADYAKAHVTNFTDSNGDIAGWTKSTGKGAGNVAFVSFHNAGHMVRIASEADGIAANCLCQVPHDDPVAALTMFSRWIKNEPLAK
jgi:cathepsin A (carboxypeptidase C)